MCYIVATDYLQGLHSLSNVESGAVIPTFQHINYNYIKLSLFCKSGCVREKKANLCTNRYMYDVCWCSFEKKDDGDYVKISVIHLMNVLYRFVAVTTVVAVKTIIGEATVI